MTNIWLQIYEQIHETLRDSLKRRDQIIAFYLVLLAAVISAWDKLGETRDFVVLGAWAVGIACLIVLAQYWRWQVILHLSMVTVQTVIAENNQPSLEECRTIWNDVNKTNETVWSFLNPCRGVEISMIYLFTLMTFVPGYLFYRDNGPAIFCLQSEVSAFLLCAAAYVFILTFGVALLVKKSSTFNERHWMFRWLKTRPQSSDKNAEMRTDQSHQMRDAMGDFEATAKKWIRDPNGWIAICTIILVLSGFWALGISKDTEKRQLRAYVAPTNLRSSVTRTLLTVEFNIENFGQTPAKSCNIRGNASILPFPLPAKYDFQVPKNPIEQKSRIDPGPIADSSRNNVKKSFILSTNKASKILAEDTSKRIYVYGVLNYEDIFDEVHYTNFCYFMTLDKNSKIDSSGRSFRVFTWSDCDQHTDFN